MPSKKSIRPRASHRKGVLEWETVAPFLLRPPGQGIPVVSAGAEANRTLEKLIFGKQIPSPKRMRERHASAVKAALSKARVLLLGVPSDTGAGIRRGAAEGPRALREQLYAQKAFMQWVQSGELLDLGDVFTNPHLLHDDMLNEEQIRRCQEEMYPDLSDSVRHQLPVSPLSIMKCLLQHVWDSGAQRVFVLGGDHSVAWPVVETLFAPGNKALGENGKLGIVQFDAHTDLLSSRFGVRYCFGTWSSHANDLMGRDGRLVQVGIRVSAHDQAYWEKEMGVKQVWSQVVTPKTEKARIADIISHLKRRGVTHLYVTNDIDGTDQQFAGATGTPATKGLSPRFVRNCLSSLRKEFIWVASDLVEVAPSLAKNPKELQRTLTTATEYCLASLAALME